MPAITQEEADALAVLYGDIGQQPSQADIQYFIDQCIKAGAWPSSNITPIVDVPGVCKQRVVDAKQWKEQTAAAQAAHRAQQAEAEARPWIAKPENRGDIAFVVVLVLAAAICWKYRKPIVESVISAGRFFAKLLYALTSYRVTDAVRRWRSFDKEP